MKNSHSFKAILLLFFAFVALTGFTQTDSTQFVTYDLIYMKDGTVLKGEILSFDEPTGGIVFKDTQGRNYSLSREQYDYFVENKVFPVEGQKKVVEIKPRKETEFEFNLGFTASMLKLKHNFTEDDYFINAPTSLGDVPICFKLGAGKYLNRQNFIGLSTELALSSQSTKYFSAGVRYFYQYDAYKRNVTFYIPIEIQFNSMERETWFQVADTTYSDDGLIAYYPSDLTLNRSIQSLSLNVGQGFSFMLNNKKSVSLELSFVKLYGLSEKFKNLTLAAPNSSFSTTGFKFSMIFNI